jgi:hypothetical protein
VIEKLAGVHADLQCRARELVAEGEKRGVEGERREGVPGILTGCKDWAAEGWRWADVREQWRCRVSLGVR